MSPSSVSMDIVRSFQQLLVYSGIFCCRRLFIRFLYHVGSIQVKPQTRMRRHCAISSKARVALVIIRSTLVPLEQHRALNLRLNTAAFCNRTMRHIKESTSRFL